MGNQRHHNEGHAGRFARTWTRDKCPLLHGLFTDCARLFHRERDPQKLAVNQCQRWIAQCPRGARWPASHTFGASGASCFAHPYRPIPPARVLGSQALRQPRLRAVVASNVLDAPSRHGCRGHPSSEGPVGELHMRTRTECAPPPAERHRGAARVPPPNPQVAERAKACKAQRTR
jgi:hypothetical protein